MATLTETAHITRQLIKYGSISLVVILFLRLGFAAFFRWWDLSHPPPPPPATVTFGKLPAIPFPEQNQKTFHFELQTISGDTGEFNLLGNVYFMPKKTASLLALDRATGLARKLDFIFEPVKISETAYEWTKDEPFPSTLRIETLTDQFTYETNWQVRPDLLTTARAPSEAEAISIVRSWLSGIGKLPSDLASGEAEVSYLKLVGTEIVPALSQSEAQLIRVDLFRAPIEEKIVRPLNPDKGIVRVMYIPSRSRSQNELTVIDAQYNYHPVEYEQSATYPLISSREAWKILQEGEGYFAQFPNNVDSIIIRSIRLGYFDPPEPGFFLQPVFIFEGDPDFIGYTSAIIDEWISKPE